MPKKATPQYKTLRITPEAHRALYEAQAPHESFSMTVLRLISERNESMDCKLAKRK